MFCAYPALVLAFAPVGGSVHLAGWEKVVAGANSLSCRSLELTRRNLIRQSGQTFTGQFDCMKPKLVRARLDGPPASGGSTVYLRSGDFLYEYDGATKAMTEHRLTAGADDAAPRPWDWSHAGHWLARHPMVLLHRGQVAEDVAAAQQEMIVVVLSPVATWFYRCMLRGLTDFTPVSLLAAATRPGELVRRFDVTLSSTDDHYVYLRLAPRHAADRVGAESLLLVLTRPDCVAGAYRPTHVRAVKANGQEIEDWKLADVAYDLPGLTAEFFECVPPPADWKVQRPISPAKP